MYVINPWSGKPGVGGRLRDPNGNFFASVPQRTKVGVQSIDREKGLSHVRLLIDDGTGKNTGSPVNVELDSVALDVTIATAILKSELPATLPHPSPNFTASKTLINQGEAVTLNWMIQGVNGVFLDSGSGYKPEVGEDPNHIGNVVARTFFPSKTTTYILVVRYNDMIEIMFPIQVTVVPVVPPPTTSVLLGVHTIVDAEMAKRVMGMNCGFIVVMENRELAQQLKASYPNAIVVHRPYIADWKLTGRQLADRISGSAGDGVIYELYNEADSWPYGSVDEIRIRIDNELEAAGILLGRGLKVCFGAYSMGCPNFLEDGINLQMRRYTPLYNSNPNVFFSMHLYSPKMGRTAYNPLGAFREDIGTVTVIPGEKSKYPAVVGRRHHFASLSSGPMDIWYERRWEFLYTRCGFDPKLRKLLCTETGVDEGGVGGFPAHNATDADVQNWIAAWQESQNAQLVLDGQIYPSPMAGAAIFQAGNDTKWAGYNVNGWLGLFPWH